MASLNAIGLNGWQILVARSLELAQRLKQRLDALDHCKVLNLDTLGPSVVWRVLPPGRNAKEINQQVIEGRLPADKYAHFAAEIHRLFEKREKAMDPALDARISFTSNIGHRPPGFALPAWKAVLLNPKTDEKVLDRLVSSIEELL
jgi:glutamate/tyrosine decarboxylase-like PLP-dependent enzyme